MLSREGIVSPYILDSSMAAPLVPKTYTVVCVCYAFMGYSCFISLCNNILVDLKNSIMACLVLVVVVQWRFQGC